MIESIECTCSATNSRTNLQKINHNPSINNQNLKKKKTHIKNQTNSTVDDRIRSNPQQLNMKKNQKVRILTRNKKRGVENITIEKLSLISGAIFHLLVSCEKLKRRMKSKGENGIWNWNWINRRVMKLWSGKYTISFESGPAQWWHRMFLSEAMFICSASKGKRSDSNGGRNASTVEIVMKFNVWGFLFPFLFFFFF